MSINTTYTARWADATIIGGVGEHTTLKGVNLKAISNTDCTRIEKVIIKL